MKVTPEMLLFLAGKIYGEDNAHADYEHSVDDAIVFVPDETGHWDKYEPHADKAQFAEVVLWALSAGLIIAMYPDSVMAWQSGPGNDEVHGIDHDNTPSGIMEATVVAVCRALGYEEAAIREAIGRGERG